MWETGKVEKGRRKTQIEMSEVKGGGGGRKGRKDGRDKRSQREKE